jgi:hypothetical protein
MVWVILVLIVVGLGAYLIWKHSEPSTPPTPVDPEQAVKAAIELHRIRSNFDVSWIKSQQRREAARLRREIAEVLKPGEGD